MNKEHKKLLKEFCKWLEKEERQNWEIERYVEDLLIEINETLNKIIR